MCLQDWKSGGESRTMAAVSRLPVHQPPPPPVVEQLMSAGVSWSTAMAMESWKAREVLDLLRHSAGRELRVGPSVPARGSI
jgi:hypothetical protein